MLLGLCQGSTGAAVTDGHSGHKSDPSVAVLTPAAKGLTPMAVNVTPVVEVVFLLLLLYNLTSFDTIMIKISDVSYGITVSTGV